MSPRFSTNKARDRRGVKAVAPGQNGLIDGWPLATNLGDEIVRQLPAPHPLLVNLGGDGFEMVRVDATRVEAQMIYLEASRDRSLQRRIEVPVSQRSSAVYMSATVAVPIEVALPFPTVSHGVNDVIDGREATTVARKETMMSAGYIASRGLVRDGQMGEGAAPAPTKACWVGAGQRIDWRAAKGAIATIVSAVLRDLRRSLVESCERLTTGDAGQMMQGHWFLLELVPYPGPVSAGAGAFGVLILTHEEAV